MRMPSFCGFLLLRRQSCPLRFASHPERKFNLTLYQRRASWSVEAAGSAGGAGSVANSRGLVELLILDGNAGLCGEDGELLGEGRIWIEGESRLSFAHHVNHFDAG